MSVGAGSDARSLVDGVKYARLGAARAVSGSSRNGYGDGVRGVTVDAAVSSSNEGSGGDGVTGAMVDAAGDVSGSNVDGGGDGVTGATEAVGFTAEAAGAAELGGSRRTRQG